MGAAEVEAFLTAVTVEARVEASKRNQAISASLFLHPRDLEIRRMVGRACLQRVA